jgi:CRISPR system Cascade subunit CasE
MLYLSKLTLETANPAALRATGDLHTLHRLVMRGFPDFGNASGDREAGGAEGRVLYRLETPRGPREQPVLLVQSALEPNWSPLAGDFAVEGPRRWEPGFATGQRLRFRLRATPTRVTTFGEDAARPGRRRVGLFTEEAQREWLTRKAGEHGFTVNVVALRAIGWQSGRGSGGSLITHHAVEYDGILQVRDADAFTKAVIGGIGPAKGFGFGLLSLARA